MSNTKPRIGSPFTFFKTMSQKHNKEWFKIKAYPHIGLPIYNKDKKWVCSYVKDKNKIESHSFAPFIHKKIIQRKYRKEYNQDGNLLNDGQRVLLPSKKRDLFYSNHLDANIYAYYSHKLNKEYEKTLKSKDLNDVVTAYRRIVHETESRNKCNIDFANDVFSFIKDQQHQQLTAITFDIKSFFDTLRHKKLKQAWCKVLGVNRLDKDHYRVFRNITKFSYVEEKDIFNLFKDQIIVKTKSGKIRNKKVSRLKYLQNQGAIAFCKKKDLHLIRRKGLIRNNKYVVIDGKETQKLRDYGICQGSPISSVLANMYMLDFDECINNEVNKSSGLYRRYSDDMVIVCPSEKKDHFIHFIETQIKELAELEIQPQKTQVFHFYQKENKLVCGQEFNGKLNDNSENRKFEYLGFSFDGEITSIKTSSLAKYYRKMKLNVRRGAYYSQVIDNNTKGKIFKRRLYKKFSYVGAKRIAKYERMNGTTSQWRKTHKYNWGNFITYAKLAQKTMNNNNIKSQIKNHWKNLNDEIKKHEG